VASVPPPAPHGTINVIGRDGYACASAEGATVKAATPAIALAIPTSNERRDGMNIVVS
jgi:hypothetical protein